ncbi:hypothetical protein KY312_00105 [Candidatus Woesearchaeota archaeon]|nr:hypothetical protein [Candidatus Woesearchaeota archaeon]
MNSRKKPKQAFFSKRRRKIAFSRIRKSKKYRRENNSENLPVSVFSTILSPLEAAVKYLKENLGYNYRTIGKLLNRDERTIWYTYFRSKEKYQGKLEITKSEISIPISLLQNRKASILQHIVLYLKKNTDLNLYKIAKLLNKNRNSIWSAYNRAKTKLK